jgi:hypothetical protein
MMETCIVCHQDIADDKYMKTFGGRIHNRCFKGRDNWTVL